MAYRGPALQYKIRKTTINNKTGDNYSITIPKFIANQFDDCFFRIGMSGNRIYFESGCKLTIEDIKNEEPSQKIRLGGGHISFR